MYYYITEELKTFRLIKAESDRKEVLGALAELTGIVALKLKELEPRNVHGETTGILEQEITKRTEAESELEKMR